MFASHPITTARILQPLQTVAGRKLQLHSVAASVALRQMFANRANGSRRTNGATLFGQHTTDWFGSVSRQHASQKLYRILIELFVLPANTNVRTTAPAFRSTCWPPAMWTCRPMRTCRYSAKRNSSMSAAANQSTTRKSYCSPPKI